MRTHGVLPLTAGLTCDRGRRKRAPETGPGRVYWVEGQTLRSRPPSFKSRGRGPDVPSLHLHNCSFEQDQDPFTLPFPKDDSVETRVQTRPSHWDLSAGSPSSLWVSKETTGGTRGSSPRKGSYRQTGTRLVVRGGLGGGHFVLIFTHRVS